MKGSGVHLSEYSIDTALALMFVLGLLGLLGIIFRSLGTLPIFSGVQYLDSVRYLKTAIKEQ